MISRKLAGASAASVGAATAVAALLLGTMSGNATEEPTASAYGIAATGLLPISPTPSVQAPPDGKDALLELPSPLGVGVLTVNAQGHTSAATAADLDIADLIKATVIKATCDNGTGDVSILGGDIAGNELPADPGVGEGMDLAPVATVTANRQTTNENGTLTVDGLVVSVLPGGNTDLPVTPEALTKLTKLVPSLQVPTPEQLQGEEPTVPTVDDLLAKLRELNPGLDIPAAGDGPLLEIVISSATCGAGKATETTPSPTEAPKPKPIETQLPVTH